jgi:hypothetical protein
MKQINAALTEEILTKVFPITHHSINTKAHIFCTEQKSGFNPYHGISLGCIGDGGWGFKEK